jgi:hypothetical protein
LRTEQPAGSREEQLRRHLEQAHRQLIERDADFRQAEEDIHRLRERQVSELRAELERSQAWAAELQAAILEMQSTRAWRLATRLRSVSAGARRLTRFGR